MQQTDEFGFAHLEKTQPNSYLILRRNSHILCVDNIKHKQKIKLNIFLMNLQKGTPFLRYNFRSLVHRH